MAKQKDRLEELSAGHRTHFDRLQKSGYVGDTDPNVLQSTFRARKSMTEWHSGTMTTTKIRRNTVCCNLRRVVAVWDDSAEWPFTTKPYQTNVGSKTAQNASSPSAKMSYHRRRRRNGSLRLPSPLPSPVAEEQSAQEGPGLGSLLRGQ